MVIAGDDGAISLMLGGRQISALPVADKESTA